MSAEKTEPASQKKLDDARKKGDIAHSKDFTQTLLILSLFGYLLLRGRSMFDSLAELVVLPSTLSDVPFGNALSVLVHRSIRTSVEVVGPFLLIVIGIGVFAETLQIGFLLAFEKIKPSGKKLNAIANLKNIFSKRNFVEFLKSSIKIVFLAVLVWRVIDAVLPKLFALPRAGIEGVFGSVAAMMGTLLINVALAYLIIGLADLAWQRFQHRNQQKMTKQEVKQEYKEMEGDPHVKSMRRHLQKEMAMQGEAHNARCPTAMITNPTHVAIAIYYEKGETALPIVLAKGEGALASRMIEEARTAGVPIMRNVPLARALLADAQVDQFIPDEFIEPIAEVLRMVRDITRRHAHEGVDNDEGQSDGLR